MKKVFLVSTVVIMISINCYSQNVEKEVKNIREKFSSIENKAKTYKKETFTFDCGSIVYSFDGTNLRKVLVEINAGDFVVEQSYYYWDNKLFFVYWVIPQGGAAENNVPDLEYRFYYFNGLPIRHMKNKEIVAINKADHNPTEVYATGTKIIELYKTKKFQEKFCQ
jgi:hypothetical protein